MGALHLYDIVAKSLCLIGCKGRSNIILDFKPRCKGWNIAGHALYLHARALHGQCHFYRLNCQCPTA